jgi:hypothetical protein
MMNVSEVPKPLFCLYERVVVVRSAWPEYIDRIGERGTIVCLESQPVLHERGEWAYSVHLPAIGLWMTCIQSDLESLGSVSPESDNLATRPEISFDIILQPENPWAEGTFRLPGGLWQVAIFGKADVPEIRVEHAKPGYWKKLTPWERDASGVIIRFPQNARLSRDDLLQAMSGAFGFNDWTEVRGPDSMLLR